VATHQRAESAADEPEHVDNDTARWILLDFERDDFYMNYNEYLNASSILLRFLQHICTDDTKFSGDGQDQRWLNWPQGTLEIESWLHEKENAATLRANCAPWTVPKVRIVHSVTQAQAQDIRVSGGACAAF